MIGITLNKGYRLKLPFHYSFEVKALLPSLFIPPAVGQIYFGVIARNTYGSFVDAFPDSFA